MHRHDSALLGSLRDRFDGALRIVAVGSLDAGEFNVLHERDDANCSEEVFHDLLLEALYTDGQEKLYRAGSLRAVIRLFDDALAVTTFEARGDSGTFVSLDTDAGIDPTSVVEVCRNHRTTVESGKSD